MLLPLTLSNQDFRRADPEVARPTAAEQTIQGGLSERDRAEYLMVLKAIAAGNRDALGGMKKYLEARVHANRDGGLEDAATDRLLCRVEYGLQRAIGAPVEGWVSQQLRMAQPGWAEVAQVVPEGVPAVPAQAVARALRKAKPSKKGTKGEGVPKRGKKGDPPPPPPGGTPE